MLSFDNLMRRTIIFVANIDFHLLQQLNHNLLLNRPFSYSNNTSSKNVFD